MFQIGGLQIGSGDEQLKGQPGLFPLPELDEGFGNQMQLLYFMMTTC